jgi:predicted CXXCH cytochrome family protein
MKARLLLVLMVAFALTTSLSAQKSGVIGTAHDLRTLGNAGDVCISCHTPHNANPTSGTALLWIRAVRTTGYNVYNTTVNPDFGGGTPALTGGNQVSLLCLSCHDGAAALNVTWDAKTLTGYETSIGTGGANLGTDLRNDHPIGFLYSDSVTAKGTTEYNSTPTGSVKLQAGRVECASCHQVHNNTFDPFLRQSNDASALCLACHK